MIIQHNYTIKTLGARSDVKSLITGVYRKMLDEIG
jgi:hypothetical protein